MSKNLSNSIATVAATMLLVGASMGGIHELYEDCTKSKILKKYQDLKSITMTGDTLHITLENYFWGLDHPQEKTFDLVFLPNETVKTAFDQNNDNILIIPDYISNNSASIDFLAKDPDIFFNDGNNVRHFGSTERVRVNQFFNDSNNVDDFKSTKTGIVDQKAQDFFNNNENRDIIMRVL